jgi:hypothetical protein
MRMVAVSDHNRSIRPFLARELWTSQHDGTICFDWEDYLEPGSVPVRKPTRPKGEESQCSTAKAWAKTKTAARSQGDETRQGQKGKKGRTLANPRVLFLC